MAPPVSKLKCAACPTTIEKQLCISCMKCKNTYCLECAAIPKRRYLTMSSENKVAWICFDCKAKQPKMGNINTPVRSAASTISAVSSVDASRGEGGDALPTARVGVCDASTSPEVDFVNAVRGSVMDAGLDVSAIEDSILLSGIGEIIRKELVSVIDGHLNKMICQIVSEYVTAPMQKAFRDLTHKISLLEGKVKALESELLSRPKWPSEPVSAKPSDIEHLSNANVSNEVSDKPVHRALAEAQVLPPSITSSAYTMPLEANQFTLLDSSIAAEGAKAGEWVTVVKKRSKTYRDSIVRGTATPNASTLQASERWRYLHLYYLKLGTTEDQVHDHLCNISGCDNCKVEGLKARGDYASFKLTVPSKLASSILSPLNWPEDICIKPWHHNFRSDKGSKKS